MKTFVLLAQALFALNEPITSDPYYGQRVGDIEAYMRRVNSTPVPHGLIYTNDVRTTVGTVDDAKYYAVYSGLSYCSDSSLVSWSCKHCKSLGASSTLQTILSDIAYEIKATVSVDSARKAIVISFRGSVNTKNWIENLKFDKTRFDVGEVHIGFKNSADALQPHYELVSRHLLEQYPDHALVLTGHSSGGSVALLAAIYLQKRLSIDWGKIQVFTYGQPRVGNAKFSAWVNTLPFKMTRVVNDNDVVPHMPPNFAGYYHQHTELYINHGTPVFCRTSSAEDAKCSNSRVPTTNIQNHMSAFGVGLGTDSC